jgi:hypothetical protein
VTALLPLAVALAPDPGLPPANATARRVQVGYDLASARARLLAALGQDRWERAP